MGDNQHIRTFRLGISFGPVQSGSVKPFSDVLDKTVTALHDICRTLSPGTSVPPNIPVSTDTLFFPLLPDLWACDAFVVTIVPLADVFGDFDLGIAWNYLGLALAVAIPG